MVVLHVEVPKQDATGVEGTATHRRYTGFNSRWDASHVPEAVCPPDGDLREGVEGSAHPRRSVDVAQPSVQLLHGDVIETLKAMPAQSVHCVITSPPYYGLRAYGIPTRKWADGIECVLGDEPTLADYIAHLVEVMDEVKRVLHPRGSLWLNLGDCYAAGGRHEEKTKYREADGHKPKRPAQAKLSKKTLLMVPARVAIALSENGWILRQDNIWAKALSLLPAYSGSVMPESTRDRTTWAHEHMFHLTLREDAFYDQDGYREPYANSSLQQAGVAYRGVGRKDYATAKAQNPSDVKRRVVDAIANGSGRNLRNVWVIPKENQKEKHFAAFPSKLPEVCLRLATPAAGTCGTCGDPLVRRVVREPVPAHIRDAFEASRGATAVDTGRDDGHTARRPSYRRRVLADEWTRQCGHTGAIVPATVLDIFSGSGRTGVAALRNGRSYKGIDINRGYHDIARRAFAATGVEYTEITQHDTSTDSQGHDTEAVQCVTEDHRASADEAQDTRLDPRKVSQ